MEALLKKYSENQYSEWGKFFEDFLEDCYHEVFERDGEVLPLPEYKHHKKVFVDYVNEGRSRLSPSLVYEWLGEIGPGAIWQPWMNKTLQVGEDSFTIVGKPDIICPDRIIDLKTSNAKTTMSKYGKSVQHAVYIWFTGKEHFDYLVHCRKEPEVITKWSFEMSPDVAEDVIRERIEELMDYLRKNPPLLKLFNMNFDLDKHLERTGGDIYAH